MYGVLLCVAVCVGWVLMRRARTKTVALDVENAECEGETRFRVFQTHCQPSLRKVHIS